MNVKTESVCTGEFLVSEGNNTVSREQVPFAANLTMEPGNVVGKASADGLYSPLDPAASDGTETAADILYAGKVGGDGVIIARLAEVVTVCWSGLSVLLTSKRQPPSISWLGWTSACALNNSLLLNTPIIKER